MNNNIKTSINEHITAIRKAQHEYMKTYVNHINALSELYAQIFNDNINAGITYTVKGRPNTEIIGVASKNIEDIPSSPAVVLEPMFIASVKTKNGIRIVTLHRSAIILDTVKIVPDDITYEF